MGVGEIVEVEWAEGIEFKLQSLFHCGRHHQVRSFQQENTCVLPSKMDT